MRKILIAMPEELPPELATDPDVLVVSPEMIPPEVMAMLDEATNGALSGSGALEAWAGEEEREHGMAGLDDDGAEESAQRGGKGDDEDEEKSAEGDDEDEESEKKSAEGRRSARQAVRRSPLQIWARRSLG